jgi:hypothetical protein
LNAPTSGGWADLVYLFRFRNASVSSGHIHELQLALEPMVTARSALHGHAGKACDILLRCITCTRGLNLFWIAVPAGNTLIIDNYLVHQHMQSRRKAMCVLTYAYDITSYPFCAVKLITVRDRRCNVDLNLNLSDIRFAV